MKEEILLVLDLQKARRRIVLSSCLGNVIATTGPHFWLYVMDWIRPGPNICNRQLLEEVE